MAGRLQSHLGILARNANLAPVLSLIGGLQSYIHTRNAYGQRLRMLVGADGFSDRAEANICPDSPEFASFGSEEGPGIEDFQIIGEAKPGYRLLGCGFPVHGASLCMFQWVYHLRDGTRQYIEGATNPEYVVAADDMDKLIAVECIPMDDRGLQVATSPNGDGNGDVGEITHCHYRSTMERLIGHRQTWKKCNSNDRKSS